MVVSKLGKYIWSIIYVSWMFQSDHDDFDSVKSIDFESEE